MAEPRTIIARLTDAQVALFWSKVAMGYDHECWPWQGQINADGYGRWSIRIEGQRRSFYAHRLAYALIVEPIGPDLEAAHSVECVTRACCNPLHITPKSHWDNIRDIATRRALALEVQYAQTSFTTETPDR